MKRQRIWLRGVSLLAAVGVLLTSLATASAAGGNGLRISPVRSDVTINPGQTQVVNINVTNVTVSSATFQAVINDFIANPNESGEPALILDPNQYASSHSLKRYIANIPNFTLGAGQEKTIPVTINVPKDAAGGGYYGAIRFAPASVTTGPNQNVSLAGSVGSLILVKVPGNIKEQMSIASFEVRRNDSASSFFTSDKNLNATIRFQNEGNLQEEPFGKILLKNRSGKTLATYEVNNDTPPANVLPDSIRKFSIPINHVSGFGEYKLEGNFGYGSNGQLLSASTTIYVIPRAVIIIFIVIVLLLAFLIFILPKLIRAYNRWILSRAGRALGKNRR